MPDIRLIALDLDGTLLDDDHATIPARNVTALRAAAARGAAVTIASGRAWALLTDVAAQLDMVRYAFCSNGAAVLDRETGNWLVQQALPHEQACRLFDLLRRRRLPFEVYCSGKNLVERGLVDVVRSAAVTPEFLETFERHSDIVDSLDAGTVGLAVEKVHVFHVPPEDRQTVLALAAETGPLSTTCSFGENLELAAGGVTKCAALAGWA